jgi:putative pyruvate formate lyase activating enzyme
MIPGEQRFLVSSSVPAYLAPGRPEELAARARAAAAALGDCHVCPRNCGVDRLAGETGTCQIGRSARISSAFAHFGEERCLVGTHGSGTLFFGGCNLRCVFCQNADISQSVAGREYGASAIAEMMLALQAEGCHNINFVTPTHVLPQVLEALAVAVDRGLRVPVVYNTSAYDSLESLRLLDGVVDLYMPDFKLWSEAACERYLTARDYAARARDAIVEMHRQVGPLRFTADGVACRGVLVRHLVMPGLLDESAAIFGWLVGSVSPDTYVNIMGQYHPCHRVGRTHYAKIDRRPTAAEMGEAYRLAREAGLWRCDTHSA